MKKTSIALTLAAAVLAGPALAFAQTTTTKPAASTAAKKPVAAPAASAAVHATKGVVKTIDATTLVITKVAGKGPETTFMVNATTKKEGTLAAGASVDVRYKTEGKDKIATAITVQEMKAPAAKTAAAKPAASTAKPAASSTATKK